MIALALGGRTVSEWKANMSRSEFLAWGDFYRAYPFDDYHRFHRPAALVASSIGGGEISNRLDWLQPPRPVSQDYSEADLNTLKAFGYSAPRKG